MPRIDKKAIIEIETLAKKLNLPEDIAEAAIELFKLLQKEGFVRGRSAVCVAMACLYYIIKLDPSCPAAPIKNFADKSSCIQKEIYRFYTKMVGKFGMQPQVCTIRPTIYVKSFGQKLGFSKEASERAVRLSEEMVKEKVHIGKSPIVSAAACLRVIDLKCGKKKDLWEIAELCGITVAAISNALALPFFAGKIPRKEAKYLKKTVLLRLLRKLIKVSLSDEGPMPIISLKRRLRLSLPDELKNHQIGQKEFFEALKTLESENLLSVVPLGGCSKLNQMPRIHCLDCEKNMRWWSPCSDAKVLFKKISQINKISKSAP